MEGAFPYILYLEWFYEQKKQLYFIQRYFRGDIRKCSYEIEWDDENGRQRSYIALRGPVETKIDYI